ncbi:UNVERIFIED_CONTAM: hypothetical protein Slati_1427700 [Sesamum latifolium]|uniref:Uncharacterized protein n=1 Tax=Sesamum latifolium TaxID=2727402 RepID=A0AAW2X4G1_9LAMI
MIEYPSGLIKYCPLVIQRGDYYSTKKLIKHLSLPVEKINTCNNGCMLYWKDDVDLEYCKFYGDPRYKSTRGRDPRQNYLIDVFLEPLIEELLQLWHVCVRTYDHATNNAFILRTALMRTVNDLPAYGMASGWSIVGVMGCQVCMDDTRAFHLQYSRKAFYFDCHKQFLPEHHPYRRNNKAFTINRVENKVARPRLTGDQILDWVADISPAVEMSLSLPSGYGSDHKWTNIDRT